MVDIKRWYFFKDHKPEKKGLYLLMISIPNKKAGFSNIGIVKSYWNGRSWDIDNKYSPCQWKYMRANEIEKYPDFMNNNIKIDL